MTAAKLRGLEGLPTIDAHLQFNSSGRCSNNKIIKHQEDNFLNPFKPPCQVLCTEGKSQIRLFCFHIHMLSQSVLRLLKVQCVKAQKLWKTFFVFGITTVCKHCTDIAHVITDKERKTLTYFVGAISFV